MKNSITTILFDLGGVLINLDYHKTIRAFEELGVTDFSKIYSQANQNDLFDRFETGQISAQYFINALLNYLPKGTSANKVVDAWNKMILDFPKKHEELLKELKEKYTIVLLSNTNELHVPVVLREFARVSERAFSSYFDHVFYSHELKRRKPHPETFEEVCKQIGKKPSEIYFIDDSEQHILGAQTAGLETYHLTDQAELLHLFS